MITSFIISLVLGVVIALATGVGLYGMAMMGLAEAVIMIYLYIQEYVTTNQLSDTLINYVQSPLEDSDYLKITVKLPSGGTASKMVAVSDFDDVVNTLRETDGVVITNVQEFLNRTGNEEKLTLALQILVDNVS